jgi:hypothetical protein
MSLDAADIEILQFDATKLARLVAELLDLQPRHTRVLPSKLFMVGDASLYAGWSIPVLLGFPTTEAPIDAADFPSPAPGERPGVLLLPSVMEAKAPASWSVISLDRVLGVGEDGKLTLLPSGQGLLDDLRSGADAAPAANDLVWPLPRDAKWEELLFERTSEDRLLVSLGGTTKDFDAHGLRMIDGRGANQKSRSWIALGWFIEGGGRLAFADISAKVGRGNMGKSKSFSLGTFRKMKEKLGADLQARFGLHQDPIRKAGPQAYETLFRVRDSDPRNAPARRIL